MSDLSFFICCCSGVKILHRRARHRRLRILHREQLRTVLHQLLQRETAAVLQPENFEGNQFASLIKVFGIFNQKLSLRFEGFSSLSC